MRGIGFAIVASIAAGLVFRWSGTTYVGKGGLLLRLLSSTLIACCVSTFQLILCEILQAGDPDTRVWLWQFDTAVLIILLGLLVPAVQIYRLISWKLPRLRIAALVVYAVYLFIFSISSSQLPIERYVDDKNAYASDKSGWFALRQDSLACISFVGITVMAFLCGISSVSAPYTAFFYNPPKVTEVDVSRLTRNIGGIDELIAAKELEISRLRLGIQRSRTKEESNRSGINSTGASGSGSHDNTISASSSRSSPPASVSNFVLRLVNMVRTSDDKQAELKDLLTEKEALYKLKVEVQTDLKNANQRIQQQKYASTFLGYVGRLIFSVFAIYCIYRVANSYIRMGWWFFAVSSDNDSSSESVTRKEPKDALVLLIATGFNRIFPEMGVQEWTRVIGVFMSGAVLAAALNGGLRTAYRVVRHIHRSSSTALASIPLDVLFIGQIAGVYVLSIATTLRFNLPKSMSGPIVHAVASPLKVSSVQLWNDMVLCGTSTVVIIILIALSKLGNDDQYYDEEMGIVKQD